MGVCPDEQIKCTKTSDCVQQKNPKINIKDSECEASLYNPNKNVCSNHIWCPQLNSNTFPVTEVHNLQNVKFINVIMDSYLNFNGGIERSQGQDGTQIEYPRANPTQFKVNELL